MALIIGIDEAGRGPIAGPVSVGVVMVKEDFDLLAAFPGLNDSKKLSEKKREALFEILEEEVLRGNVQYRVEFSSAQMIDEKGIVPSVSDALERGLRALLPNAISENREIDTEKDQVINGKVFLDGALHAPKEYVQETVIGGDGLIPVIMLASVAAKVTRDRYMIQEIASRFPAYSFEKHKGYGTKAHYEAITANGICDEHRRSFLKSFSF